MSRVLPTAMAVLSLTAVAGLAHAQMGQRANLDANGDGVVAASEFEAIALQRFQRMDANQDGVIDATELAAIKARMQERRADRPGGGAGAGLDGMDADKDGRITQAEALAASKARFAKLDQDGDGKLSESEQAAMRPARPAGAN